MTGARSRTADSGTSSPVGTGFSKNEPASGRTWLRTIRPVLPTFGVTRGVIWIAALAVIAALGPVHLRGDAHLQHDLGSVTDVWARWDSLRYLFIARHGYTKATPSDAAFYP